VPVEITDQMEPAGAPGDLHATEDEMLVAAAKKGQATAFAMLVERHQRKLFFAALRITRNREDAEDVVQQSFQKTFVHLASFVGRSSFSTWLTRVAINEALMLLRKNRGSREVLIDDLNGNEDTATPPEVPDSTPDPEVIYSHREWERMLSSAMNKLPHETRRAIQLRELDERSTEETARIMGISVGAVKARVFHGRKKLREKLEHYFGPAWTSGSATSRTIADATHVPQGQLARNACG
jgi:RNA polymerase sigma-70 factor, ECF subfamily